MKKYLFIIVSLFTCFAVGWSWDSSSDNAVKISGNIEVTEIALSFRIGGVVAQRLVEEGMKVSKGQVIAKLDDSVQKLALAQAQARYDMTKTTLDKMLAGSRVEEIELAKAQYESAKYNLQQLLKGPRRQQKSRARQVLKQAKAAYKKVKAQYEMAKADYKRYRALFETKTIGEKEFLRYKTAYDVALESLQSAKAKVKEAELNLNQMLEGTRKEQINMGRAALAKAKAYYEMIKKGPRDEDIEKAKASLRLAKADLDKAKLNLNFTVITSPIDGIVLSKATEPGEYAMPGRTIVTVCDLSKVWVRGYVSETKLGLIKLGQKAVVTVDSLPNEKFRGTLGFISQESEFTPKTVQTFEERVKLVYRVKVYVNNENFKLKPGMPADVIFTD